MRGVSTKSVFSKKVYVGNGDLPKFNFIFCSPLPIFLNDIFHDVICLVNTDAIFTLNNVNFEEFYFEPSWRV